MGDDHEVAKNNHETKMTTKNPSMAQMAQNDHEES